MPIAALDVVTNPFEDGSPASEELGPVFPERFVVRYLFIKRINLLQPRDLIEDDTGEPLPDIHTQSLRSLLVLVQPQTILQTPWQSADVARGSAAAGPLRIVVPNIPAEAPAQFLFLQLLQEVVGLLIEFVVPVRLLPDQQNPLRLRPAASHSGSGRLFFVFSLRKKQNTCSWASLTCNAPCTISCSVAEATYFKRCPGGSTIPTVA